MTRLQDDASSTPDPNAPKHLRQIGDARRLLHQHGMDFRKESYPWGKKRPWHVWCMHCHEYRAGTVGQVLADLELPCPHCGAVGPASGQRYAVYLLTHEAMNSLKVGIAWHHRPSFNSRTSRGGWKRYRFRFFESKERAQAVERQVLGLTSGFGTHLTPQQLRGGSGSTETRDRAKISAEDLWALVERCADGGAEALSALVVDTVRESKSPS